MPKPQPLNSNTVAFRADPVQLSMLDADCRRLGVKRSALVRSIVALHYDTQPAAVAEDLRRLVTRTTLIHRNQARMLVTLLVSVGKLSVENAKDIVRTDLLK